MSSFTLNSRDPNPLTGQASKDAYEAMERELKENRNATIVELIYAGGCALKLDPATPRALNEIAEVWLAGVAYALRER